MSMEIKRDPFLSNGSQHKTEILKNLKYARTYGKNNIKDLSIEELQKILEGKVRIWSLLTSRNQDFPTSRIQSLTKKELIDKITNYEDDCSWDKYYLLLFVKNTMK